MLQLSISSFHFFILLFLNPGEESSGCNGFIQTPSARKKILYIQGWVIFHIYSRCWISFGFFVCLDFYILNHLVKILGLLLPKSFSENPCKCIRNIQWTLREKFILENLFKLKRYGDKHWPPSQPPPNRIRQPETKLREWEALGRGSNSSSPPCGCVNSLRQ